MQDLIRQIEAIQDLLIDHATGGHGDNEEYKRLRTLLLTNTHLPLPLPSFVRPCRDLAQFWSFISRKFQHYAEPRQFIWDQFRPLLDAMESVSSAPADGLVSAAIETFDAEQISDAWGKALRRRTTDPEGAITAARTLVESVCKHVLDANSVTYDDAADLNRLYRQTAEVLHVAPAQHTETVFKQILGGCTAVVEGLGALRNRVSDSHGRGRKAVRPAARHAELAVNLAGALAMFLLATHLQRADRDDSPDNHSPS